MHDGNGIRAAAHVLKWRWISALESLEKTDRLPNNEPFLDNWIIEIHHTASLKITDMLVDD